MDFFYISKKVTVKNKKTYVDILPKFIVAETEDVMIRGGDFYAVWLESRGLWSTNEYDLFREIDKEIDTYAAEHDEEFAGAIVSKLYMRDSDSGSVDRWHKYCKRQMAQDHYKPLDECIVFSDQKPEKTLYASKRLDYSLVGGDISAWDKLIGTLYLPEERHKIEWAIGAIVSGDSKWIQKFLVLYGSAGSGKSTVLNIIEKLFKPYCATFDAKALGNPNSSFALEPFKSNPLVAIQHDGDLSRIEDNARLNSLVSHEELNVNEKFKSLYSMRFQAMLFIGTNKPVRITDAKSGLMRRLIDITPSGELLGKREYNKLLKEIDFELGAIASHCLNVYESKPGYYDKYVPTNMIDATNDFYNFISDTYFTLIENDPIQLTLAWSLYKDYVSDANLAYSMNKRAFKDELKNYYETYEERKRIDGKQVRNLYSGFKHDIFDSEQENEHEEYAPFYDDWLNLSSGMPSLFDKLCSDCYAQYASKSGTPKKKWDQVTTRLADIDSKKLHYVRIPENHIVIDFDIRNEEGEKDYDANIAEASKWPKTYAECSKSGGGIHLHYIYDGDPSRLSSIYSEHVEIKVYKGNSALRRLLTKCNNIEIAHISGGLPLKEERSQNVIDTDFVKSEKALRTLIIRNLRKEYHPATKPSIDFIKKILDDAYNSDLIYNVEDMKDDVLKFAAHSTNNSKYCLSIVKDMKFASKGEAMILPDYDDDVIVFYDVEVFPNLFVICFMRDDSDDVIRLINPSSDTVKSLFKYKLVGFNNRDYDNHIIWYASQGYSNNMLYEMSQSIIKNGVGKNPNAYNLSYADIYEFTTKKQSLKKWEIELGIRHNELGLPWYMPVDKSLWKKVADYCCDDVRATKAVFHARHGDFVVKEVLARMAGGCVNDSTTALTTKIVFGDNKNPQNEFNYRFMGDEEDISEYLFEDPWAAFNSKGQPVFKGYTYKKGVSKYRDEEIGEGGYVYAEPGIYYNVALLDIASMHPHSAIAEEVFGPRYTKRFGDLVSGRITLKHINAKINNGEDASDDIELAKRTIFDGEIAEFLDDQKDIAVLPNAFKLVINKVYGLSKAHFNNAFRDNRNVDNIIAKRGALFMVNLKHAVQERGFTVAHIKTDSIKIPNATPEIINFVINYGKAYGYTFEHEATYERMCLVNDAVYIARYSDGKWTATGKQFAVPYVFKSLFSHEDITFDDIPIVFTSKGTLFLDMNEGYADVTEYEKELNKVEKAWKDEKITSNEFNKKAEELEPKIAEGHNYKFIGRVGEFVPVLDGEGGGLLLAQNDEGKYSAASGTKGWRFKETVDVIGHEGVINYKYYDDLCDKAVETIEKFGSFDDFTS